MLIKLFNPGLWKWIAFLRWDIVRLDGFLKIDKVRFIQISSVTCPERSHEMKPKELEEIRNMIELEIEKTQDSIEQYRELTKPIAPENAIGRVSRMDAINNRSVTEAALRTAEKKLSGLRNILPKVGDADFGQCARCKQPIPIQRILLVPSSPFCVRCAR